MILDNENNTKKVLFQHFFQQLYFTRLCCQRIVIFVFSTINKKI